MIRRWVSRLVVTLFWLLLLEVAASQQGACDARDRAALLEFKSAFTFTPSPVAPESGFVSWSPTTDCCSWDGVNCTAAGRVQGLEVRSPSGLDPSRGTPPVRDPTFEGALGASLGSLSELQQLAMTSIRWNAPMPRELRQLQNLREFELADNNLTGGLPSELGELRNLEKLSISSNLQPGPIPTSLCRLNKLVEVRLVETSLRGSIPRCIHLWKPLRILDLARNSLAGRVPAALGLLPDLSDLSFDDNHLTGPVLPYSATLYPALQSLRAASNRLTGRVPAWLGRLPALQYLDLGSNLLRGPVPPELGDLELVVLTLRDNAFSGALPPSVAAAAGRSLAGFDLSVNRLTGRLPELDPGGAQEGSLNVSWNGLWGPVPASYGALFQFDATHNRLSGALPPALLGVRRLLLADNRLSALPGSLAPDVRPRVFELRLGGNRIAGAVPEWLARVPELFHLDLSRNRLSGSLPLPVLAHPFLFSLNLSRNAIEGTLPARRFRSQVKVLDLHGNRIGGGIASNFLADLGIIVELYLNGNELSGSLPADIGSFLDGIERLDLSDNRLEGRVPASIANLTSLVYLNLTGNRFVP